ncbi:MAG: efflux transporter outer membrane subunit [Rhodospirillaceae bacterium]|nr:efflux transporter outer membrane subunit [Rhodospirillaceae bacterium]
MFLLIGCSLAPDYERPVSPVKPNWSSVASDTNTVLNTGWRDFFIDPQLQKLIETALINNRDLRIATLNIEAARAQYQIKGAGLFPSISAIGSSSRQKIPGKLSPTHKSRIDKRHNISVGFTSYELDLFGSIRDSESAALELYFAREESRTSAQISLIAEVANAYIALLSNKELLQLTKDTLDSQKKSFNLIKLKIKNGITNELDLRQAETAVHTAEINLAKYSQQIAQNLNALELLVGQSLSNLINDDLINNYKIDITPLLLADLPADVPSALLEQRPDIKAAEHNLKAANADIGVARAAFFPKITLTATGGVADSNLTDLLSGGNDSWNFSPIIAFPIFTGGRLGASLDLAEIKKQIEVVNYEKAIQKAFREVSDALITKKTIDDQLQSQKKLVEASSAMYRLSDLRFNSGIEGYLNTLTAQRTLYNSKQAMIITTLSRMSNLITLYKTFGGGWNERTENKSHDETS